MRRPGARHAGVAVPHGHVHVPHELTETREHDEAKPGVPDRRERMLELYAVLLLSLTTLATAWSGYQASRWSGEQSQSYARASTMRIHSQAQSTAAGQLRIDDLLLFNGWLDAREAGQRRARRGLPPALPAGFDPRSWHGRPLGGPAGKAPAPSPLYMPQYRLAEAAQAAELDRGADELYREGTEAKTNDDHYILSTLFFAAVLFFAGISLRLGWQRMRIVVLGMATVLLLAGVGLPDAGGRRPGLTRFARGRSGGAAVRWRDATRSRQPRALLRRLRSAGSRTWSSIRPNARVTHLVVKADDPAGRSHLVPVGVARPGDGAEVVLTCTAAETARASGGRHDRLPQARRVPRRGPGVGRRHQRDARAAVLLAGGPARRRRPQLRRRRHGPLRPRAQGRGRDPAQERGHLLRRTYPRPRRRVRRGRGAAHQPRRARARPSLGQHEVAIPIGAVSDVSADAVALSVSKDEVGRLERMRLDRHDSTSERPRVGSHRGRRGGRGGRRHAAGAAPRAGRQLLQGRRPGGGVFGVLATGFAILLGLVVLLAFTSYDESRAGAETEALIGRAAVRDGAAAPRGRRAERLAGELVCYARSVVHQEWPRDGGGHAGRRANPWGVRLFRTLRTIEPAHRVRAGGVRQVARPAPRSREARGDAPPRRGRRHPGAAVARALLHRGA